MRIRIPAAVGRESAPRARSHYGGAMAWHWQLQGPDGAEWQGELAAGQQFPSQSDAETWLGESWRELRSHGVGGVVLLEDDRVVYGPMSLDPA